MKLQMLEDTTNYEIHLIHPDYGSEFHWIAVADDCGHYILSDEETKEYNKELFKMLREKYNKYGYWHEMVVTAVVCIDGKEYRTEVKEMEE